MPLIWPKKNKKNFFCLRLNVAKFPGAEVTESGGQQRLLFDQCIQRKLGKKQLQENRRMMTER